MDRADASPLAGEQSRGRDRFRSRERGWLHESWNRLAGLAHELDLDARDMEILEVRWLAEAEHYDNLWRHQRTRNDALGVITIVAGLATPVLVAVDAPDWGLAVAGFVVAAASSLLGFFRYGERWRHQRKTAMLLKAEGVRFIERRPPYDAHPSHQAAFPQFIENLERINEAQSEEYLALLSLEAQPRADDDGGSSGSRRASTGR